MLRFSLFGFPISVEWTFWLMAAILGGGLRMGPDDPESLQRLLLWMVAAFVSIIIHELGHAFLQRKFGARSHIHLYSFGGLAIADRALPRQQSILVSLAGPLLQIACGLGAKALLDHSHGDSWAVVTLLRGFQHVSILWGLINLVPIHPLDGGKVLLNILGPRFERISYLIGALCAVFLAVWIGILWKSVWNTLMLGALAWNNFQRFQGQQPPSIFTPH